MIAFIDDHRDVYGVEPICKVLPIAPSTDHAHVARRADPEKLPRRAKRDEALKAQIRRVFEENFRVYGVRKVWRQLAREGIAVARCTVARLMRAMGLQGAVRGKPLRTTHSDKAVPCPLDRVNRQFQAPRPKIQRAASSALLFACGAPPRRNECDVSCCSTRARAATPSRRRLTWLWIDGDLSVHEVASAWTPQEASGWSRKSRSGVSDPNLTAVFPG